MDEIFLQNPSTEDFDTLADVLLASADGVSAMGAAYAFVSGGGVDLLFGTPEDPALYSVPKISVIAGVDRITDGRSLRKLQSLSQNHKSFSARAYLSPKGSGIFHPKICWFKLAAGGGVIVSGSGNLTIGGLRGNVEAFSVVRLDKTKMKAFEEKWDAWLVGDVAALRALDDPEVVERAQQNGQKKKEEKKLAAEKKKRVVAAEGEEETSTERELSELAKSVEKGLPCLISEIPKASDRWNQANFSKHVFENYFGFRIGLKRFVTLYQVGADGSVAAPEQRQSVSVRSKNFRIELNACAHKPYPTRGRPIAVFIKIAPRTHLYAVVLPRDDGHVQLRDAIEKYRERADLMVRLEIGTEDLLEIWPDAPFWKTLAANSD